MFDLVPLKELADKAAGADAALATDEELMSAARMLESVRRTVEAALGAALGELERRGSTDHLCGHRTAQWFAAATGCPRGEAVRRVRTAGRLAAGLEHVAIALATGEISWEHARVLADLATPRTAEVVRSLQREFLDLAAVLPFERWRREVAGLVDLADADGGHRPPSRPGRLRVHDGLDGSVELVGTLDPEQGIVVGEALAAEADRLLLRHRADSEADPGVLLPTRAELYAEALVELCRKGLACGPHHRGPAVELTLVVPAGRPLEPFGTRRTAAGSRRSAGVGVRLPDGAVRTLACDPALRAVVVDSLGNPVDLGRRVRLAPDGLRRAVEVRDGGCTFPGCDAPSAWCDLHHVIHWSDGGATSAENLASLCRHHHRVSHRPGWSMRAVDGQRFEWRTPAGRVLQSQRRE